jgi:hypothetical protein
MNKPVAIPLVSPRGHFVTAESNGGIVELPLGAAIHFGLDGDTLCQVCGWPIGFWTDRLWAYDEHPNACITKGDAQ